MTSYLNIPLACRWISYHFPPSDNRRKYRAKTRTKAFTLTIHAQHAGHVSNLFCTKLYQMQSLHINNKKYFTNCKHSKTGPEVIVAKFFQDSFGSISVFLDRYHVDIFQLQNRRTAIRSHCQDCLCFPLLLCNPSIHFRRLLKD